ncbi:MAG: helix-turn-helix domain-containing protein [Oscillospiraceae bacterium]
MNRLKILRELKGISQQKLALEINVSQTMISKYELGRAEPDINTICKIAKYFGVSSDYLLEISDDKITLPVSGLSEEEKNILFGYKRLNAIKKAMLYAYLQGLLQE